MSRPDGGAAFPIAGRIDGSFQEGMSLRDWLAGMVLQGLVASIPSARPPETSDAKKAYAYADAMLAHRETP